MALLQQRRLRQPADVGDLIAEDVEDAAVVSASNRALLIVSMLLGSTDLGVVGVARRVGYDAEEAFSRAFTRSVGSAPGTWRLANSGH